MNILTGQLWKIATVGAGILTIVLMGALTMSYFDNKELDKAKAELTARINDPKTGYVVQLAQARTNEATLKVQVERQTAAYKELSAKDQAKLAETERQLKLAQEKTRVMEKRLADFMSTKPRGDTLDARVRDIDDRAMEELLK